MKNLAYCQHITENIFTYAVSRDALSNTEIRKQNEAKLFPK